MKCIAATGLGDELVPRRLYSRPVCFARSSTISNIRAVAASIITPLLFALPSPAASASRTFAMTLFAVATSFSVGE